MPTYEEILKLPGKPDEGKILLFDGHSLAYRAFYGIPELTTRDGRPVNAIYGFLRVLLKTLREFPAAYAGVVFDAGGETHRHRLYPQYKATRKEIPDELAAQLTPLEELLDALGIPVIYREGVEADDLIGTIARRAADRGLTALITTSDKDLAQLVDEKIALIRPAGRRPTGEIELFDAERVIEKYGVPPIRIVDYLALIGDSSDNIPGVPGVGPKTAAKLLQEFGDLDSVLKNADKVRNTRVREALKAHAADAILARKLVALNLETDVGKVPEDFALRGIDVKRLRSILSDLEFHSILTELQLGEEPKRDGTAKKAEYSTILSKEELEELVAELTRAEAFSLDLETTSRDPMRARIVGFALSPGPYRGYYIPVGHDYLGAPKQLSLDHVLSALRGLIEGETPKIIGQNLKYDIIILRRHGLTPRGVSFDAMIASHLARPEERHHNLEEIARHYLNYEMLSYRELAGKEGKIEQIPVDKASFYAAEDAEIVYRVKRPLEEAMEKAGATKLFREVEVPLVSVLARMEQNGILVDKEVLAAQGREIREKLAIIERDLYEIAGEEFNPNSPRQVAEVLFDHLGLPVIEKTKTGPSTSARVLAELAAQHPLPGKLIEYRELEKLLSTYIDRLPEAINPETGRIHTSFHQTSTATGRLSSSDPNLQNIPTRTEIGERIRRAFVAPEGSLLIGADYSQIELRLLAHFSGDPGLIEAFREGKDLHRMTASRIFAIPEEKVTDRLRDAAKRINFGIIYGISPFGLARELGIPRGEAKAYIDRFFAAYPRAKAYIDELIAHATERGYAETILGRRRPLPHLKSNNVPRRNFDKRNAVNTPIQGSAADLIKLAMLKLDRLIEAGELKAKMLLQIHDELIFEAREEDVPAAMETIKSGMENVMELRVPLTCKVKSGHNWAEI